MSHPNPSHDRSNEYPEDKVTRYPRKGSVHSHNEALAKIGWKNYEKISDESEKKYPSRRVSDFYNKRESIQKSMKHMAFITKALKGEAGIPQVKRLEGKGTLHRAADHLNTKAQALKKLMK